MSRAGDAERPLRFCVVGSGWRFTSGISYYTCHLTTALARQGPVSAILMRRLIPRRLYPGRQHVGSHAPGIGYPPHVPVFDGVDWFGVPSLWRAVAFLREQRPDVVVFQWWTGAVLHSYAVLALVARRLGSRVIVEFHETQDTGEAGLWGVGHYVSVLGGRFLSAADGYVVHSRHDADAVTATFRLTGPVVVAPHGPFDHHSAAQPTAAPGPPDGDRRTRLLFFGTIRPYKGLEHLVAAFSSLTARQADAFDLTVAGETWEGWTKPLEMISASPHRDRITVLNRYVSDEEVATLFAAADAVVLPYTRSSASGPLHIAMAYGLPIVLTDVGGLGDGAAGYDGVLWVPPANPAAIAAALLRLPAMRGERFPDPRSWDDTVRTLHELLSPPALPAVS